MNILSHIYIYDTENGLASGHLIHVRSTQLLAYAQNLRDYQNPRIPNTFLTSLVNLKLSKTGNMSNKASSLGSDVQPSIGSAFAVGKNERPQGEISVVFPTALIA